jgi:hypothetical protein
MFLLWLLMRRLALRLPTVLQINESYAVLFHSGGVSEFTDLIGHPDYHTLNPSREKSSRIWVLIDSNPRLLKPADIFQYSTPLFVVDAISGRSGRLGWLKKIRRTDFYMRTWSMSEVIQAYVNLTLGRSHRSHSLQSPVPWRKPPLRTSTLVPSQ